MGHLPANIVMKELERSIVMPLVNEGSIKLNNTLVLVKPIDVDRIYQKLNTFHKNIQFTVDRFDNETPYFLVIEIFPDGLSVYRKD